eukprot:TRINITY_DN1523_c1_g1_i1.p1 TRINITY_DN1523_c1_g1~~TRINITY_DN1523_c1_g1_i1.p1  ORF type:complete len:237 (-),score=56.35 TRINITY_DN1523_c1_g1_i1:151-861(-)
MSARYDDLSSPSTNYNNSVRELLTSPSKDLTSDYIIKVIVIGPSGVGKSCLIYSFTEGEFLSQHELTVGVEFAIRIVNIEDKRVKLQIWDTAGQESFRSVTSNYYRGSSGALLIYDTTKRETFTYLSSWLTELRSHADPVIMVVGNKVDLASRPGERQVTTEEGQKFADQNGLLYAETSAKSVKEVEAVFMQVATRAFAHLPTPSVDSKPRGVGVHVSSPNNNNNNNNNDKKCCLG